MKFISEFETLGEMEIGEKEIHLISASPRRREMMKYLGPAHFGTATIDEGRLTKIYREEHKNLEDLPAYLSLKKALAVQAPPNSLIVTADTVVILGDTLLGKPHSQKEEEDMLRSLFGKKHKVVTGFTLRDGQSFRAYTAYSIVEFVEYKEYLEPEIKKYLAQRGGKGKAGAYGIQDIHPYFIRCIYGDYNTIVGLPITAVREKLHENGWINPWQK
ncbi:MAG: Maf family protein [Tissierellia bacterium]|nr:Maf family protein [Tissierellia bacterium]